MRQLKDLCHYYQRVPNEQQPSLLVKVLRDMLNEVRSGEMELEDMEYQNFVSIVTTAMQVV
jgi:hypothetical protein